ncbi:PBP superfamily domain protein [compost metagenome]
MAKQYGLGFIPVQEERYDFVVPRARRERPPVQAFIRLLQSDAAGQALSRLGFRIHGQES